MGLMSVKEYMYDSILGCEVSLSEEAVNYIIKQSEKEFEIKNVNDWIIDSYRIMPNKSYIVFDLSHKNGQFIRLEEPYLMKCNITGIKFR